MSTSLVSRPARRAELDGAAPFDIVLVDEAHYARRKNPEKGTRTHPRFGNLYQTMQDTLRQKTACLWMATATPMQLDWIEVFDLLALTRRVGWFQFDPSMTWAYYQALGDLVRNNDIDRPRWDFLRRAIAALQRQDPFLWNYLRRSVIDGRIRTASRIWLEQGIPPRGIDRRHIQRLIFTASPLSRVMLRHGRALLEIYRNKNTLSANLARRHVLPVPRIVLEGLEKQAYDDLDKYCQELTAMIGQNAHGNQRRTSLGFYLSFLRLRLASSLYAIRETLRRRRERVVATLAAQDEGQVDDVEQEFDFDFDEDEESDEGILNELLKERHPRDLLWEQERLGQMLERLADLSDMPLKMRELLRVLNERRLPGNRIRQTVVFTRFFDTLQDLVMRLRQIDPAMRVGTYSGSGGQYTDLRSHMLRGTERDEIKHRFLRGEIDVLICTDAAAEGLNLQSANWLINYDLPWNPMKVEQRIGRIDRIGQEHDEVFVLNLCYADSAEQIVYERLLNRLVQAGNLVGTQQVSMLPVTREEFNDLAAGALTEEALEARARERLDTQARRNQSMEIPADQLYEIYMRLKDRFAAQRLPICLNAIWEGLTHARYLRDLGCTIETEPRRRMTIRATGNVNDGTQLTVDRQYYESGADKGEGPLHFASYGDVIFEQVLQCYEAHALPRCVVRLSEAVPDTKAELVGYAVACIGEDGNHTLRLIASWTDLEGLTLDENTVAAEADLTEVKNQLHELMRKEFDATRTVPSLEQENRRVGQAQILLDLLIADRLLPPLDVSPAENFWTTINGLYNLTEERDALLVPNLPVLLLQRLQGSTLVDVPTPRVGETTSPTVPIMLIEASLDAACRVADAMRLRRANLTIDAVKRRLKREIDLSTQAL